MGKVQRGGYIFVTWKGDHSPYHVHVYRDSTLVMKRDLENDMPMRGAATKKVRRLLQELRDEGLL